MFSWSTRHKLMYTGGALLVMGLLFVTVFYKVLYQKPTCFDGKKNGDEIGVDCGGSCAKVCTSDTLDPIVLWAKAFQASSGIYNLSALVENPNVLSENNSAQYEFRVYDSSHQIIVSKTGTTFLPKNKKFIVFEPAVRTGEKKPSYTEFEFKSFGSWQKNTEKNPDIVIDHGILLSTTTSPSIEGTVSNNSGTDIDHLELIAQVLDGKENTVAVSRTFVDSLYAKTKQSFVFVWNKPFDLGVQSCVSPSDTVLVLDRSGSMINQGGDPAEPFATVKNTAIGFADKSGNDDKVGVVTFASTASSISDLSSNGVIKDSITNLVVATSTEGNGTNITDGLSLAQQIIQNNGRSDSNKAIILLTDGVPTDPKQTGQADYPKISAITEAKKIKENGISLYVIGLGTGVSEGFLKNLAMGEDHYFFAPTKNELSNIYTKIRSSLCTVKPSVIQIIYRVVPQTQ